MKRGFIVFILLFYPGVCQGLQPDEILVIANYNAVNSVGLAKKYMDKRQIPGSRLLQLRVTDKESCSRKEYNQKIAAIIRQYFQESGQENEIRCLLTVYGLPLNIEPPEMTPAEEKEHASLLDRRRAIDRQLNESKKISDELKKNLQKERSDIQKRLSVLKRNEERSALDSELALVKVENYALTGWVPNPHFYGFKKEKLPIAKENVLFVSRLDGPTPETVQRIIDDSFEAEKTGLTGAVYFDARWPKPDEGKRGSSVYALYDKSIHTTADLLSREAGMKVVIDDGPELFQPGQCPDAALYCGWYSLGRYVDAFTWVKGAVGYHIASSECATLRRSQSQGWCKRMLEEGVAVVAGPTSEPYVNAFPVPEIFFGLLVIERLSLVECYFAATPFLSWQMVLIGDPLYRPYLRKDR